jgi:hypothetical protein
MKWKAETMSGTIVASIPGAFSCHREMTLGLVTGEIDD